MGRRNKWKVNADKYKKVRKTKRTPVQECTRRILAYKNVCKQLKDLYEKRKRRIFASGSARKRRFFGL